MNAMLIEQTRADMFEARVHAALYYVLKLDSLAYHSLPSKHNKASSGQGTTTSNLGDDWCPHGSSPQGQTNHEHRHEKGKCSQGRFPTQRPPKAVSLTCPIQRSIRSLVVRLSRFLFRKDTKRKNTRENVTIELFNSSRFSRLHGND